MTGDHSGDRRRALGWLTAGGIVAAVAANRAGAAEKEVDVKGVKVDAKAMAAAEKYAEDHFKLKVTWLSAVKIEEGEKTAFELDGVRGEKKKEGKKNKDEHDELEVTIVATVQGKVIEVDRDLKDHTRVPEKALAAVVEKWKTFKLKEAHEIRQGEDLSDAQVKSHTVYDLCGAIGEKARDVDVQVSKEGEILEYTVELPKNQWPPVPVVPRHPKFTPEAVLALYEKDKIIGHHFVGKIAKMKELTVAVSPDGKRIEVVE